MRLLKIRNWEKHYENARTLQYKTLTHVLIPNNTNNGGLLELLMKEEGLESFGIFILLVELASTCKPRGELWKNSDTPYDVKSLSMTLRIDCDKMGKAIQDLLNKPVEWLESVQVEDSECTDDVQDKSSKLSKDKLSKDKNKEKKRDESQKLDYEKILREKLPAHLNNDQGIALVMQWLEYKRKEKKFTYKELGFEQFVSGLGTKFRSVFELGRGVKWSMGEGYTGLFLNVDDKRKPKQVLSDLPEDQQYQDSENLHGGEL